MEKHKYPHLQGCIRFIQIQNTLMTVKDYETSQTLKQSFNHFNEVHPGTNQHSDIIDRLYFFSSSSLANQNINKDKTRTFF